MLLPLYAGWEEIRRLQPEGLFISSGPGDPRGLGPLTEQIRRALGELPALGIALGCQLLALAGGGAVSPMRTGHHGGNYPVREPATGRTEITVQNHAFAVDGASLTGGWEVSAVNLNDGGVEGIRGSETRAAGVQYLPLPDDDGRPHAVFQDFVRQMEAVRGGTGR
jgi:carbamoyl-phosphate synthase small subunit